MIDLKRIVNILFFGNVVNKKLLNYISSNYFFKSLDVN
ncbi:hypothetical protein SAMN05421765_2883 [Kaistella antarctica]|uniref:Uncharacterized protein n=1 Tax=Kaistella antarctica TaxID=266748 RepID=A0A3S4YK66_9FLAO|nr:hypothetical protein SAMN05421765_2883 [Kaistella antarctica]VEH99746.1 Uncharacterised protein [Kaistella antarctica]